MDKLLRTLIEDGQISLVAIDSAKMVRHAQIIHNLTPASARVFGRIITVMSYMSCWLKNGDSELSVNFKHRGDSGEVCVSGNGDLHMRGYVYNPFAENDEIGKGYMTIVRDDNYKRPFVGTCEMISKDVDENFEYYYRLSEQLPTYIKTEVTFDENGLCKAAGGVFLQPMPMASDLAKQYAQDSLKQLTDFGKILENTGMVALLKEHFKVETWQEREIEYRCHCSRDYIAGVLTSMGEDELRSIILSDGKVNVHCHYCNSDYDFTGEDVDKLFPKENEKK